MTTQEPIQPADEDPSESTTEASDLSSKTPAAKSKAKPVNPMVHPSRTIRPHGIEGSRRLAAAAVRVAMDNNGQDIAVLDVCAQSSEFDLFVLATGQSRRQLHAISEQIDDVLEKELGERRSNIEGYSESRWIVLDYGSVVVHLFDDETREFYDLESLWADGKEIPLSELGIEDAP